MRLARRGLFLTAVLSICLVLTGVGAFPNDGGQCEFKEVLSFTVTPAPQGLAWGNGYLWGWISRPWDSGPAKLAKIDAATGSIVATYELSEILARGAASDGSSILVFNHGQSTISKIDPETGAQVGEISLLGDGYYTDDLAWDGTYLWLLGSQLGGRELHKIRQDGTLVETFTLPTSVVEAITSDGSHVWEANYDTGELYKVDTVNGEVIEACTSPVEPGVYGLTWDGTNIWASDTRGKIYKLALEEVTPNQPPVANFTWEPSYPNTFEPVRFIDQSDDPDPDGEVVSWLWDFKGITRTEQNPVLEDGFPEPGEYEVCLTVTDDKGASSPSICKKVSVKLPEEKVPVIVVPGIMGSKLVEQLDGAEQVIWPGCPPDVGELKELESSKIRAVDVIRDRPCPEWPWIDLDYYGRLVEGLEKKAGYTENKDLYVFPYDRRKSIVTAAQALRDKLQTFSGPVDLLAHSMGGLVAQYYINERGKDIILQGNGPSERAWHIRN